MDGKGKAGEAKALPQFLSKTYDMVDDPSTNSIISWGANNNSLIVWDPPHLEQLLPKKFKHRNFRSFVRQLNKYGFRKVESDRWEYVNEGFLRGQKHLLKTITWGKPAQGHGHQHCGHSNGQNACVEVVKFGLEEEVERLVQEVVRLRQQQKSTDNKLQTMVQHILRMENRQQEFISFLAKAVQSPHFLSQFLQHQNQQQNESTNKNRRFKRDAGGIISNNDDSASRDGQIVKYQPPMHEQAMFKQLMKTADDGFLLGGNATCTTEGTEMETLSTPESVSAAPEATENCIPPSPDDVTLPEFDHMLQENNADENFLEPNMGGLSPFLDPPDLLINDSLPFDIDDLPMDPDVVNSSDYNIFEDLLRSSSVPDDMDFNTSGQ